MFLLKIVLAPLLIGIVSLAERKWGNRISGLMVGLPLTSGPVLFCLALEHGAAFSSRAAVGCLLGQFALAAFTLVYARVCASLSWWQSLSIGVASYLVVAAVLLKVPLKDGWVFSLVCATLIFVLLAFPRIPSNAGQPVSLSQRELLVRMAFAGSIVFLLTTAARVLGAEISGLLAPLPVYTGILAVFNHMKSSASAASVLKGVVTGAFGATAFCGVVMSGAGVLSVSVCFIAATLAALAAQLLIYPFVKKSYA